MIINTIPIPEGWSIEQSWEAIRRGDTLPKEIRGWENVETDEKGNLVHIFDQDEETVLKRGKKK